MGLLMVVFWSSWQMFVLLALFALWAVLLFGGFIWGKPALDGLQRMPVWTRMASSAMLALIAWLGYAFARPFALGGYALLIAIGMTLGLTGDLLLSGLTPIPQPTLAGIAAFGSGHVFYMLAAFGLARQFKLDSPAPRWSMLALWLLIGLLAWYFVVFRGQSPTILTWAALPYSLLLASVAGLFVGLALQSPALIPAAIGAILFLISDLILASQLFTGRTFPLIGDIIWLTYGPGQALIVASVAIVSLAFSAAPR
jgi:hypothetical protein